MVYLMKYMLLSTSLLLVAAPVLAAADAYTLTIENHAFVPKEIVVKHDHRIYYGINCLGLTL